MKAQYTLGPWTVDEGLATDLAVQAQQLIENSGTPNEWVGIGIEDADGFAEVVALCHPINARLIAAAPELFIALKELKEAVEYTPLGTRGLAALKTANTVIAKAE